jgi:tetratricopeptide (TPR) repeat protein
LQTQVLTPSRSGDDPGSAPTAWTPCRIAALRGSSTAGDGRAFPIDTDPTYALAYAGVADSYNFISFLNLLPPREAAPKARAAAEKASEIDDRLAKAHNWLGYVNFTYDWDWPAATRQLDRAIALNREAVINHPYYPFYLTVGGRFQEAVAVARRALERDPISAYLSHTLAVQFVLAGRFAEGIEECRRTLARREPRIRARRAGSGPCRPRAVPGSAAGSGTGGGVERRRSDTRPT